MDEFHIFMGGMRSNKENHTITGKEAIKNNNMEEVVSVLGLNHNNSRRKKRIMATMETWKTSSPKFGKHGHGCFPCLDGRHEKHNQ
jgi:hypothetical protein